MRPVAELLRKLNGIVAHIPRELNVIPRDLSLDQVLAKIKVQLSGDMEHHIDQLISESVADR